MWQFVSECRYQTVCRYRCQGLAWTDGSDSGWVFCLVLDRFWTSVWIVQWRIIRNFCSEIVSSCVKMNVSLFNKFHNRAIPIPFENFEVISKINKMTRPLFTYVVQWSYGSMSYASVCFEPYLVIDARNMELTATYHPSAYVGGCHVCTFALSHLFWLCSLEGRRQQTFGETTSLLFTNRDLRSPTLLTGF